MTKEQANAFFTPVPARAKGSVIVWKDKSTDYKGEGFRIGIVAKKAGDKFITTKYDRIYTNQAFSIDVKILEFWPKWDEVLGYKRIGYDDLLEVLEKLDPSTH